MDELYNVLIFCLLFQGVYSIRRYAPLIHDIEQIKDENHGLTLHNRHNYRKETMIFETYSYDTGFIEKYESSEDFKVPNCKVDYVRVYYKDFPGNKNTVDVTYHNRPPAPSADEPREEGNHIVIDVHRPPSSERFKVGYKVKPRNKSTYGDVTKVSGDTIILTGCNYGKIQVFLVDECEKTSLYEEFDISVLSHAIDARSPPAKPTVGTAPRGNYGTFYIPFTRVPGYKYYFQEGGSSWRKLPGKKLPAHCDERTASLKAENQCGISSAPTVVRMDNKLCPHRGYEDD